MCNNNTAIPIIAIIAANLLLLHIEAIFLPKPLQLNL